MQTDLLFIRRKALAFIGCALFLAAMMGMIFIDVSWMNDGVHETSFTEVSQELILLVIALLFFHRAYRQPAMRSTLVLVGGFFSCMLIRELDFLFDEISHGSWVWFALAVTAICLVIAMLHPKRAIVGLATLLRHPGWGMMSAGLLTILVFSRLFGMGVLWRHLMLDGYNHTVKNMVEEGCELLGYSLCLLASLSYLYSDRITPKEELS
ncbi:hypothetical protein ACMGGR_20795 [Erwinia sp. BNK-24-b]|uniref:hypothetical protein n=1 Tax=Erwinia TaxID=551 RepID=UPI001FEDD32A|nr:hypothetical protein [Erwinia phyllosphaerae]MBV4367477.1 hypothetical protein [Erwinia phyllosphaerae]